MDFTRQPPAARFAAIVAGLKRGVAVWAARNPAWAPVILLLFRRLSGMVRRLDAIAAAPVAKPRRRRPRAVPPAADPGAAAPQRPPYPRLPGKVAWLPVMAWEARAAGSQLRHLLDQPDMVELLTIAPRAGRVLRPLCRILGVWPLPPILALPPRPPRRRKPKPRKPRQRRAAPLPKLRSYPHFQVRPAPGDRPPRSHWPPPDEG